MNTAELSSVCKQVRRDIITMIANAGSGHPGGSLSMVELMTSVFYNHMRIDPKNPKNPNRDRFVLSKGHAAPCYYAVLAELGFISRDEFKNFRQLHSILQGHPDCKKVPGVDASTGSLGQGCSIAVGMALGAKLQGKDGWGFTQSAELRKRAAKLAAPDASIRVDYTLGVAFAEAGVAQRAYVLDVPAGALDLGDGRTLVHPALQIRPDDRIALIGANGLGKSTLLRHLLPQALVPEERLLNIPQEISENESRRIHEELKRLDDVPLGRVMTLVSRLGSRPARLLASTTPSPGEIRKILLARGVARGPTGRCASSGRTRSTATTPSEPSTHAGMRRSPSTPFSVPRRRGGRTTFSLVVPGWTHSDPTTPFSSRRASAFRFQTACRACVPAPTWPRSATPCRRTSSSPVSTMRRTASTTRGTRTETASTSMRRNGPTATLPPTSPSGASSLSPLTMEAAFCRRPRS